MTTEYVMGELIYYAHVLSKSFKELIIMPIGDAHFGNPAFSLKHFDKTLNFILDNPNCYTVLMGDLCESVIRTSVGDIYKQIKTPQDQRDWMIERLMPIKEKILGCVTGNHEMRIYNMTGVDISKDIAEALECPYRPEGMLIKVSFGVGGGQGEGKHSFQTNRYYTYFVYFTHGYGGARTSGAKAVKVERTSTFVKADVYIMAHDHSVNVAPAVFLEADPRTHVEGDFRIGRVVARPKTLVKTNSYVKWAGYSEMGGFAPVNLIAPKIRLQGEGKKEVIVEVSSG